MPRFVCDESQARGLIEKQHSAGAASGPRWQQSSRVLDLDHSDNLPTLAINVDIRDRNQQSSAVRIGSAAFASG
jgi:hypothetical protein